MHLIHSHSSLDTYVQCPFKYAELKVFKRVVDTQSSAGAYGEQMHKAIELRVANGTPLPPNFAHYERIAAAVAAIPGEHHAELKLGVTEDLEPCDFWDKAQGWFRGIIDLLIVRDEHAIIIDWKTGKYRPGSAQPERCALLTFAHYPQVQTVSSRFIYFKDAHSSKEEFVRSDMDHLARAARATAHDIQTSIETDNWPKRPSGLCGWCPVKHCPNWRENKRK